MITLYTKNVCPKCMGTELQLKGLGLPFEKKNLDAPENQMIAQEFREKGYMSTPVLDIDGVIHLDHREITDVINALAE